MIPPGLKRIINKTFKQPVYALKIGLKRAVSRVYYMFGNGLASRPESITLFLTHRCNLRCKMCGQWGEVGVMRAESAETIREELSIDALKSVVDDIAGFSPGVTLFGGEPFLYKDCIELIRYIKSKNMHCLVITNALLVGELAGQIVDSGLDELNISIDAPGDLHDQIRGVPGLFEKIMAGLELVKAAKKAGNKNRPLINIQCTINRHNYQILEEMMAVAERAGADSITFHNLIFMNKEILDQQKRFDDMLRCSSADWKGFDFDPGIDPAILGEKMKHIMSAKYDFGVDFYPNFSRSDLERYYKEPSFVPSEYSARCLSPWITAYVFPDGEVRPCLNCSYSYGNIKKRPFASIWNSPEALKYRRTLKANKLFPTCARCTELYRY